MTRRFFLSLFAALGALPVFDRRVRPDDRVDWNEFMRCKTCGFDGGTIIALCQHRMRSARCAAELGPYIATYGDLIR